MDYSQWQQPPAPATQPVVMNQAEVDAYYASYYAYYAPSLNQDPNSTSALQTHDSSANAIPPPPGVVDAYSSAAAIATTASVTVDTTPYYTLDSNAQSLAWREAVRMYGKDPLATTEAGATVQENGTWQPHSIHPAFLWSSHIVQAQLPGVSSKKQLKKAKIVRSAYCEVCKVDCNGPSVFEQHKLGKKHLKNLEKLKTCLPLSNTSSSLPGPTVAVPLSNMGSSLPGPTVAVPMSNMCSSLPGPTVAVPMSNMCSSLPGPTVAVPLIGPQEDPSKSKARKKRKKKGVESAEDLESKRQKVMECGTSNESIRLCRICNVVCNSDKVYSDHLAGQKHIVKAAKALVNA